jgi:hypothetical protein
VSITNVTVTSQPAAALTSAHAVWTGRWRALGDHALDPDAARRNLEPGGGANASRLEALEAKLVDEVVGERRPKCEIRQQTVNALARRVDRSGGGNRAHRGADSIRGANRAVGRTNPRSLRERT